MISYNSNYAKSIGYIGNTIIHQESGANWTATQDCWILFRIVDSVTGVVYKLSFDGLEVISIRVGLVQNVGWVSGLQSKFMIPCKAGTVITCSNAVITAYNMIK